jgi:hypothetical protein
MKSSRKNLNVGIKSSKKIIFQFHEIKFQLLNEMADKMKDEIIKMEDDDVIKTTMIDKLNELKQLFSKK